MNYSDITNEQSWNSKFILFISTLYQYRIVFVYTKNTRNELGWIVTARACKRAG